MCIRDSIGTGQLGSKEMARVVLRHPMVGNDNVRTPTISEPLNTHPTAKDSGGVVVIGTGSGDTHLAHCCNPTYGDDVVGYQTRGRGVSVHRAGCHNLIKDGAQLCESAEDVLSEFTHLKAVNPELIKMPMPTLLPVEQSVFGVLFR